MAEAHLTDAELHQCVNCGQPPGYHAHGNGTRWCPASMTFYLPRWFVIEENERLASIRKAA